MTALTQKQKDLVKLAKAGGKNSDLVILDMVHELQDEIVAIHEEIQKEPPTDLKVEKVALKLAVKLAILEKGEPGTDGYTPKKGVDYFDGEPGYTPIKGKDYFDGKDAISLKVEDIVPLVLAELPPPENGSPGKDADEAAIQDRIEKKLPTLGASIIDAINLQPTDDDEDKIDASHIKNLPKAKEYGSGGYGGGMSQPLADGHYTKYHGGGSNLTVSVTQPVNPELNDLWVDIS